MESIFACVPGIVSSVGSTGEADTALAFAAWNRCAGEMLRERTEPISLDGKKLTIAVADATWKRNLEELSPRFIASMGELLGAGKVKFIEFIIDARAKRTAVLSVSDAEEPIADERLVKAASAIKDESLRRSFLSAATVVLSRGKE